MLESHRPANRKIHSAEWKFPETTVERLRYSVFKDLWHKGYYLTAGIKFGGDFLAYPGEL